MKFLGAFIYAIFIWSFSGLALAQANSINGTWLTEIKSHITIEKCNIGYCGYISKVAIRPKLYEKNKQAIDRIGIQNAYDYFNKDPNLQNRRLLGLNILTLDTRAENLVFSGHVYNPEDGKTYKGKIELLNNNQIKLTGCAFMGVICSSEIWYRIQ